MNPPAWEGGIVMVLAGLAYDVMLTALRRFDRGHPEVAETGPADANRWLGYARDACNLLAFLFFFAAFLLLGLRPPLALLATSLWVLGLYGLDYLLARLGLRRPHLVFFVVAAGLAASVAALREPVAELLATLVARLFPR